MHHLQEAGRQVLHCRGVEKVAVAATTAAEAAAAAAAAVRTLGATRGNLGFNICDRTRVEKGGRSIAYPRGRVGAVRQVEYAGGGGHSGCGEVVGDADGQWVRRLAVRRLAVRGVVAGWGVLLGGERG